MKKAIFLFNLLLFSIPIVYSQPSDTAINCAISWAQSLIGQKSFPLVNETGYSPSFFACSTFVSNAYGWPAASYYAYELWDISDKHIGDLKAPRGSLVFYDKNDLNFGAGHVALSIGNGEIIEAGYDVIIKSTINDERYNARYLGWAWPRTMWPGRSTNNFLKNNYHKMITLISIFLVIFSTIFIIIRFHKQYKNIIEQLK